MPPSIPATNEHMYMSWMRGRSEQASRSALLPRLLHAASNVVAALAVFASNVVGQGPLGLWLCLFQVHWCGARAKLVDQGNRAPHITPDVAVSGGEVY